MAESNIDSVKKIVLLLGNFHTIHNLLGCIGYLMLDTGLSNILCEVYGESKVNQILSGKAYYRALRGHLLVDQVLSILLFEMTAQNQNLQWDDIIEQLEVIHNDLIFSKITLTDFELNSLIMSLSTDERKSSDYHRKKLNC